MRVAPIGLAYFDDLKRVASVAIESSRPTHSHSLAYQAAVIQATAVASATTSADLSISAFLHSVRCRLSYFSDLLQNTSSFETALAAIENGLADGRSSAEMTLTLGTGIEAHRSVPMALYCFLQHPHSYADVIHDAVFIGGDTDTIAAMAGAISGAFLGKEAIPRQWLCAIREPHYTATAIEELADQLHAKFGGER
jgi:poly(ADP-ribose) glycohydrolase ARH3